MDPIARRLAPLVAEGIDDARIVFLAGARQVGKTTLIRHLTRADGDRPMLELSLDDTATREAASADPAGFVAGFGGPTFIDEIQRVPELLLELKRAVDADVVPGRFVITGSANVLASKRILDALPGRIDRFTLWPLAQAEIEGGAVNLVDALFAAAPPPVDHAPVGLAEHAERIVAGGFPEARLRAPGRSRSRWFDGYVSGSLERDLVELADVRRAEDAEQLLRLLAAQSANLFKAEPIGDKLGMDRKTVRSYVGLLGQMHLIHQLPGWRPGLGARESTTPKSYISDVGLLCHLLGADARRLLTDDQVKGKALETFVVNELLKQATWAETEARAYHYQRRDEDVDLVLEDRAGAVVGVEVKAAATITARDWRWLAKLRDARGASFRAGVVVAPVAQTTPLGDRLWAVPLRALWA
ncbi:MAG TPA: ATP-binding protein [Baekduia sp.]|uniref:ATP-binding protein n=1 Tax=Baekduia sp. TaxID=2600305 RepID=UPI002D77BE76|nr:ATP-binding protein [Baekduia sp.]HET6508434.1 ATP-binding protein [Baekduia sp.]